MDPKPIARIYYSDETAGGCSTYGHDVYTEDKLALLLADYGTCFTKVHANRYQDANLEALAELLRNCGPEIVTVGGPDDRRVRITFWAREDRPSAIEVKVQDHGERPFKIHLARREHGEWIGPEVATAATVDSAAALVRTIRDEEVERLIAVYSVL